MHAEQGFYLAAMDVYFPVDCIPGVLREYLSRNPRAVADPPHRAGGYRLASRSVCLRIARRIKDASHAD